MAEEEDEEEEDKNWYTYQTMNLNKIDQLCCETMTVATKRRNDLQPPKITYNHLKDIYNHPQTSEYHFKQAMSKATEITIRHVNEI